MQRGILFFLDFEQSTSRSAGGAGGNGIQRIIRDRLSDLAGQFDVVCPGQIFRVLRLLASWNAHQ